MKNMKILCSLLALTLLSQASFSESESDSRARVLKEAKKQQELNAKGEPKEVKVVEKKKTAKKEEPKKVAKKKEVKKNTKNMTESEKMSVEIERIQKRVSEINNDIDTYKTTNEKLDLIEGKLGDLETRVGK